MSRKSPDAGSGVSRLSGPELSGTNPALAGDHNQRVTLHAIRVSGLITRNDIAALTGLTSASISNITKRLLRDGLILDAGRARGGRGAPSIKLVINPDGCFSVGVNIDRDHITLVVLDFVGKVRARSSCEIAFARPQLVREFFQRSVGKLLAKAHVSQERLIGVGVAFPDDIARAHLHDQPRDYEAWANVKVDDLIRDVLDVPVFVENDAAAAAIGEMQFGSGHRYRSFFYLLVTAALGGGLVVDGSYFRGADGRSGEIGWLRTLNQAGVDTQLQNIVSLSGLYGKLAEHGFRVESPRGLARLEPQARRVVDEWIREATEALANTLLTINCLINPEAILIGGRLPAVLIDQLAESLNASMRCFAHQVPAIAAVARATTSDDAPAVGAAILPFSNRFLPTRLALLKAP